MVQKVPAQMIKVSTQMAKDNRKCLVTYLNICLITDSDDGFSCNVLTFFTTRVDCLLHSFPVLAVP